MAFMRQLGWCMELFIGDSVIKAWGMLRIKRKKGNRINWGCAAKQIDWHRSATASSTRAMVCIRLQAHRLRDNYPQNTSMQNRQSRTTSWSAYTRFDWNNTSVICRGRESINGEITWSDCANADSQVPVTRYWVSMMFTKLKMKTSGNNGYNVHNRLKLQYQSCIIISYNDKY